MKKSLIFAMVLALGLGSVPAAPVPPAGLRSAATSNSNHTLGEGYQQYFRFIGSYPFEEGEEEGTPIAWEVQGIAHDDKFWYFANNHTEQKREALWRIPVEQDLTDREIDSRPGVLVVQSNQIWCPTEGGMKNLRDDLHYHHFGDLVAYKASDRKYYLLVPLEGYAGAHPAIAVFRADSLQCLGLDVLRIDHNNPPTLNNAAAWCAVDPDGYVYTSPDKWSLPDEGVVKLFKYSLNWDTLGADPQKPVQLTYLETILLKQENGQVLPPDEISGYAQGGEFSPDGKLLYVSSGGDGDDAHGGIQVFDTQSWRRVARSHNENDTFFQYNFDTGFGDWEEPEGLTVWDLDEGITSYQDRPRAPGIYGQLHVLLLRNCSGNWDEFSIYHYTNTIYVDSSYPHGDSNGFIVRPFRTVGEALTFYNQFEYFDYGHWTGSEIKVHAGSYDETLTFSRRMQITGWGRRAVVGSQGQVAITPEGAINIESGGALRLH